MTIKEYLNSVDWNRIVMWVAHSGLLIAAVYVQTHPELAPYAPVLQAVGQSLTSPR